MPSPEVNIIVTPSGVPMQIAVGTNIYQWPDLHQGVQSTPSIDITPYVGNTSSPLTGPTFRQYHINTQLTFSGTVTSLVSGAFLPITSYRWDLGDGTITNQVVPTHTYRQVANTQVVLGLEFADGSSVFTPKQMNLTN